MVTVQPQKIEKILAIKRRFGSYFLAIELPFMKNYYLFVEFIVRKVGTGDRTVVTVDPGCVEG